MPSRRPAVPATAATTTCTSLHARRAIHGPGGLGPAWAQPRCALPAGRTSGRPRPPRSGGSATRLRQASPGAIASRVWSRRCCLPQRIQRHESVAAAGRDWRLARRGEEPLRQRPRQPDRGSGRNGDGNKVLHGVDAFRRTTCSWRRRRRGGRRTLEEHWAAAAHATRLLPPPKPVTHQSGTP